MNWINVKDEIPESNKNIILKIREDDGFKVVVSPIIVDKNNNICYNGKVNKDIVSWMPLPKADATGWRDPVNDIPEPNKEVLCLVENQDGSKHAEVHKTAHNKSGDSSWSNYWHLGGMYSFPVLTGWMPMPEA